MPDYIDRGRPFTPPLRTHDLTYKKPTKSKDFKMFEKPKHIHDYQYVEKKSWYSPDKPTRYIFVCPISGCSKPVKVVKEK